MTFRSPFPDVTIPDLSLQDYVFEALDKDDLEHPAIIHGPTSEVLSYGDLARAIRGTAAALLDDGLKPGEVVALLAPNSPEFAILFHAIGAAGATVTTVSALATVGEVSNQLRLSHATRIFASAGLLEVAAAAAEEAGVDIAAGSLEGVTAYRASATGPSLSVAPPSLVAALPFSSGTSGSPKGVRLSHRNLVANVAQVEDRMGVARGDVVIAVLPFTHIYGMTVLVNLVLRRRATLVTMPRFDPQEFLQLVARHSVTIAFVAPPIASSLLRQSVTDVDISSLHTLISGAAALDSSTAAAISRHLGVSVRQGYGMTELSPVSHLIVEGESAIGAVGKPVPNTENRLLGEDGAEIEVPSSGSSTPGELLVRGPNVMVGYLDDAEATARTIDGDGFLHTGDLVTVDHELNVTVVDRLKELIKYKGYQVSPVELEAVLIAHPAVLDVAVTAGTDSLQQEIPQAYIVLMPGHTRDGEGIMSFVAERVAPYKQIRRVVFVEAIPRSGAGKILRRALRNSAEVGEPEQSTQAESSVR
jgi:acyl-CoA synthetase (AMP-forming)/AMP-acid ligase II